MIQYLNIVVIPIYFLSPREVSPYYWRSMLGFLFFGMVLKCSNFIFFLNMYIWQNQCSSIPAFLCLFYLICDAIYVFFHFFDCCKKVQEESLPSSYNTHVWINSWRVSLFPDLLGELWGFPHTWMNYVQPACGWSTGCHTWMLPVRQ